MDKIIVFHGPVVDDVATTYGVVRITNSKLLKAIKEDVANGMGFDELMTKYKLKQCNGESIEVNRR